MTSSHSVGGTYIANDLGNELSRAGGHLTNTEDFRLSTLSQHARSLHRDELKTWEREVETETKSEVVRSPHNAVMMTRPKTNPLLDSDRLCGWYAPCLPPCNPSALHYHRP